MSDQAFINITKSIRRHVVQMAHTSCASHTGSALSIVDILSILYFRVMRIDPKNPSALDRDRFILSKGHASAALYATLAEKGFFDKKKLNSFYQDGGELPGHVDYTAVPGIEASAGSLGHGLSLGAGMALAQRMLKSDSKIFVLVGDGEMNEGSVWEAIQFIPHQRLTNLTLIIDDNKYQGYGPSKLVLDLTSLSQKLMTFGWNVICINGHNHEELEKALRQKHTNMPTAIIADTIKGKGVSYMENQFVWHYKSPNHEQLIQALQELE
jgi:transketolase